MIFANIREYGLKKPITVVHRKEPDEDGKQFDLVCGYARLEAFIALGEKTIPAIIIKTSPEDPAQRALAENSCERTAH